MSNDVTKAEESARRRRAQSQRADEEAVGTESLKGISIEFMGGCGCGYPVARRRERRG